MLIASEAMKVDGKSVLQLPPCTVYIHKVTLSREEQEYYSQVEGLAKRRIETMLNEGTAV
jgi:hypothetical protein